MSSEITVEVTGDNPVADLQAVLDRMGVNEAALSRLAVTMQFDERPVHSDDTSSKEEEKPAVGIGRDQRLRAGTNQHIALSMLAKYLQRTDKEHASRDEIGSMDVNPLNEQQTGSALSQLYHIKELVDAEKSERPSGGGYINEYRLTDAGRVELDRVGRYDPME